MLLRWALRELRRSWKTTVFFVLNLSLGLIGFISLEAYKTALQLHISQNRQELLGGDLAVSVRREFKPEEMAALQTALPGVPSLETYDFFAMVASAKNSRLANVRAIDADYPFYGQVSLSQGLRLHVSPGKIWVAPEVLAQLGVHVGDTLKVGSLNLKIEDLVTKDSTQTFRSSGLAPRVFIDRKDMAASGLIQFGSTFSKTILFKTKNQKPEDLQNELYKLIQDPAVQIETAASASADSARQLGHLSDFLGLVALVGLFLAALGAAYLWRLFLQERMKDVAILRSLGLQGNQAVFLYVIEAAILGAVSVIPAILGSQIIFPILNRILANLTPFELNPVLTSSSVLTGLALAMGSSLLVALPFLLRLREVRPAQLFSEENFDPNLEIRKPWAFIPAVLMLWGLAILQSNSFKVGSLFIAALAVVVAVLAGLGWLLLRSLEGLKKGHWSLRHGLRSASRRRSASLSVFVALGLGSLLINLLPQIESTLQHELAFEKSDKIPSLFMFDLQDDQVATLQQVMAEKKLKLSGLSPLIRARILKVNDQNYERALETSGFRTREEDRDARFRNRGVNLSYRTELSASETLTKGHAFSGVYDGNQGKPVELSLEEAYADRTGIKIGDNMKFDIQGVELEGQVISLRKVKWLSFQPNFFILMQPGALDDAPKTWIASVPGVDEDTKAGLQNELAQRLPNVSVIDIASTVKDVLQLAQQMSWSLKFMALLAVLTGTVVLFSIARSQVRSRRWELNLLKVLGARARDLRIYLLSEFAILAALASLLGAFLSLGLSSLLVWQIFDLGFSADIRWILGTSFLITVLGILVAEQASAGVLKEKPSQIFRS